MKRIILDTDIGTDVDDAMAVALAASTPELEVAGITTVHADAPLRARIARRLLELAGQGDIPVVAGASAPIRMPIAKDFHWMPRLWGHEGVGILPPEELTPTQDLKATSDDAAHFIIETARAYPGELSMITIGPLTNVGKALQLEPQLAARIRDVTVMGGLVDTSKLAWPPVLETNLNADPGASEILFRAGIPLTIVPLEVTTQIFLSAQHRAEMRAWGQPLSDTLVTLMEQMRENFATFASHVGLSPDTFQERTYMHDPLAIYTSMSSRFVTLRGVHIQLEVREGVLRTIAYPDRTPNAQVCVGVDAPGFVEFWLARIKDRAFHAGE